MLGLIVDAISDPIMAAGAHSIVVAVHGVIAKFILLIVAQV